MNETYSLMGVAVAAGAFFGLLGISFQMGARRGLLTQHMGLLICLAGTVYFARLALPIPAAEVPLRVWTLGILSGVGQYACVVLMTLALRLGPLSPAWCAVSLPFVPVILYASFALGEPFGPWEALGVTAGIACVLLAARCKERPDTARASDSADGADRWYPAILAAICILNALVGLSLKDLKAHAGTGPRDMDLMTLFGPWFYVSLYMVIGCLSLLDLAVRRRLRAPWRPFLLCGGLATVGSVGGLWGFGLAVALPAALSVTLICVVQVLVASLVSVFAFGERASPVWFAMIGSGLAAVVFVSAPALF